jgi:hypothetical protein
MALVLDAHVPPISSEGGAFQIGLGKLQLRGIARQQGIHLAYVGELAPAPHRAAAAGAGAMVMDVVLLLDLTAHRAAAVATGDQP